MVDEALVAGNIANTNGLLVILAKLVQRGIFDREDLKAFSELLQTIGPRGHARERAGQPDAGPDGSNACRTDPLLERTGLAAQALIPDQPTFFFSGVIDASKAPARRRRLERRGHRRPRPGRRPYLWLEEIEGAKPLPRSSNGTRRPRRPWDNARVRSAPPAGAKLLNDPNQIAMPEEVMGDLVANHWVDANHKRGLWRVSPLAAYLAGKPQWRTLIDVDALGRPRARAGSGTAPTACRPPTSAAWCR